MRYGLGIAFALVVGACVTSGDVAPPAQTQSSVSVAETTASSSTPTTTAVATNEPLFESQAEAFEYIWGFDPQGEPASLDAAILFAGGAYPGLELGRFYELGSVEIRQVALKHLSGGSTWGVMELMVLLGYGKPSGSLNEPIPWANNERDELEGALGLATVTGYGDWASIATLANERIVEWAVGETPSDEYPTVFERAGFVEGHVVGDEFVGVVGIGSGTGELSAYPIRAERTDGHWVMTQGLFSDEPFVPQCAVERPASWSWTVDPTIEVLITCDPFDLMFDATMVERDPNSPFDVSLTLELEPGQNRYPLELSFFAAAGPLWADELVVWYEPEGVRTLVYVRGLSNDIIEVDPAEWLTGEEADQAAYGAGVISDPSEGAPNDYFIRNPDRTTSTYSARWTFVGLLTSDLARTEVLEYVDVLALIESEGVDPNSYFGIHRFYDNPYWAIFVGDELRYLEQQYVP